MDDPRSERSYRAGWLRVSFGALAFVMLPSLGVVTGPVAVASALYVGNALVMQWLIHRQIGEDIRPELSGLADVAYLTFLVHRIGSTSSALLSLYIFIPLVYAMIGRPRAAHVAGAAGAASYAGVLIAEWIGWLPYGPDEPLWIHDVHNRPLSGLLTWLAVVCAVIFMSTVAMTRIAGRLAAREQELLEANARLEVASQHDALTDLGNRRYLMRRLREELARVRRGRGLAVMMLDLDGFKRVNDHLGHLAGDDVLRKVAVALKVTTRESDIVGRYGGDEFAVLLTDPGPGDVHAIGERVVGAIARAGRLDDHPGVTASLGYAIARDSDSPESVLDRADANAYRAKQAGGDRVVGPGIEQAQAHNLPA